MSGSFGKVCHEFSFSSQASRLSLKAALATCLSIYISLHLNFQDPFFAGFGCFLMLLPSSSAVLTRAFESIKGAVFGGILGYFILGIFINDHFAFTLAIFAIVSLFSYLMSAKRNSFFWYYALVNLLLAAIAGAVDPSTAIDIAFFRIANVILGIFCYVVVAVIVFPDFKEKDTHTKFKKAHNEVHLSVADVLRQYGAGEYSEDATFAKMDLIDKALSELGEQVGELKNEERIFGASKLDLDIRLLDLKRIASASRGFYENASSIESRKFTFQKNFTGAIEKVISLLEAAADFDYSYRHPHAIGLLSLLSGFNSGQEKKTYSNIKDEFQPEDVLLFLECLRLCKSLVPIDHHIADSASDCGGRSLIKMKLPRKEHAKAVNTNGSFKGKSDCVKPSSGGSVLDEDDERLNFTFFGHKLFSIDLMLAKFSMKAGLAVIADFWIYFWFEIPGSATTIAISAITVTRPDIISTRHRSILRIAGCFAGVLCAFVFLAFGIQTTEIMFACLFIVAFISGLIWIADERIAYFGYQLLIAYMFSVIPNSMPAVDVTEPTQRAVGIAIGVLVAWLVMTFVFPENLPGDFFRLFRKTKERLKRNLLSVAIIYMPQCGDTKTVSANFSVEEYNSLLSLLTIVKEHGEINKDGAENIRLLIIDCLRIHRELDSISEVGSELVEYLVAVDPDLCKDILTLVSDVICLENGLEQMTLESRANELSDRISGFEKKQREKKLLTGKSIDFRSEVAHLLLSLRRMLDLLGGSLSAQSNLQVTTNLRIVETLS